MEVSRAFDANSRKEELSMNKRQKTTGSFPERRTSRDDACLVPIPESLLIDTAANDNDGTPITRNNFLPLPSKLAYPFWYDPHPIAKWAADQLKAELPPYDDVIRASLSTPINQGITLGQMYGVLVVSLDERNNQDIASNTGKNSNQTPKLGYLRAYSGLMLRPPYIESASNSRDPSGINFVPLVYDRFTQDEDGFDFVREDNFLNDLTREIETLKSCPERQADEARWKGTQEKLTKELSDAKKQQKVNKNDRKARRIRLREQLLAGSDGREYPSEIRTMSNKKAHQYFLEHNEEYRSLEELLVQESANDGRQFKALKANIEQKLERIQTALHEHHSKIQNLRRQHRNGMNELQRKLFERYQLLNVSGETQTPLEIFKDTILKTPPSGTGDCASIKLFQYAFSKGYRPVALAEFWWGPSPQSSEVARKHGNYYPCSRGKCEPLLNSHMLVGTNVEADPLTEGVQGDHSASKKELSIVYEDKWLVVVDKPHNVLSVPGRTVPDSIKTDLQRRYPDATGPLLVHRLDYSTSGLLLAAKDSSTHKVLQAQFIARSVQKRYEALLEGNLFLHGNEQVRNLQKGTIDLPLAGDYLNRPMQKVERGPEGKPAVTHFEVVGCESNSENDPSTTSSSAAATKTPMSRTRIYFYPQTGRTHQLRVHASHPEGLGMAILGDDIYGQHDARLCLHAGLLTIEHPHTKERMTFEAPVPF